MLAEAACTGANAIPWTTDCLTDAGTFNMNGGYYDAGGNTLQCRYYHASVAFSDPAAHCPHAAPDGGGVCIDM